MKRQTIITILCTLSILITCVLTSINPSNYKEGYEEGYRNGQESLEDAVEMEYKIGYEVAKMDSTLYWEGWETCRVGQKELIFFELYELFEDNPKIQDEIEKYFTLD